jgi:hypothetical protein
MAGLVCVGCMVFLKIKRNGVAVEEGMPTKAADGSDTWGPYKLWMGDLYECPKCGTQLLTGFGRGPLAEHYQPTYAKTVAQFNPIGRVDACEGARP